MVSGVQGPIRREGFAYWVVLEFPFGYLAYILGGWVGGGEEEFKLRKYHTFFFFSPSPPPLLALLFACRTR